MKSPGNFWIVQFPAIDKKSVQKAVVVIVEQRYAAAHRFRSGTSVRSGNCGA